MKRTIIVTIDVEPYDNGRKVMETIENMVFENAYKVVEEIKNMPYMSHEQFVKGSVNFYELTDFMDACNNEEISLNTVWVGYCFVEDKI